MLFRSIYSPRGEKVGRVSHLRNREFLFVVSGDRAVGDRLAALGYAQSGLDGADAVVSAGAAAASGSESHETTPSPAPTA